MLVERLRAFVAEARAHAKEQVEWEAQCRREDNDTQADIHKARAGVWYEVEIRLERMLKESGNG